MGKESRTGPVEALRNLALGLERLAAREAMAGAMSGAADGLRKEIPELDGQVRDLVSDALKVLGRLMHEAAEREHQEPGTMAYVMASSAMQGALEVLERERVSGGKPIQGFVERLNHMMDGLAEFARNRTAEIRSPGERAQAMAVGVVTSVVEMLHDVVPMLAEDARRFAPSGAEIAAQVGRGLLEGVESKLREDSDALVGMLERIGRTVVHGVAEGLREELEKSSAASTQALEQLAERTSAATVRGAGGALKSLVSGLRRPLMAVVGAGGALLALTVLTVRWRTA
ncbi:hypothetical protein JY651_11055 [Pyxidicoccus parkwayensis]|uniref:Uncharacterized protein n=1 Tax=Pyxidicoccus parkwayensis TaxID=2813578 RepID=A0ABX7P4L9_9BACT|nr:hypothetical protein [Pyxidicoccus parkwaysis]QSQ25423.1 hypothetical protein JY651_11055 [Pyxidicoccus parkwaysis]